MDVGPVAILGVASITLAVAAFVLFLDFSQRVHRAFALFLVLRAMMDGMIFISLGAGFGFRLRMYWFIAVPFAALHFCLAYRRRHGHEPRQRPAWLAPLVILSVALAFEILYLVDHDLFAGPVSGLASVGPLASFESLRFFAYAAVAWVFAAEYRRTRPAAGKRALVLASVGFALTPLYFCTFSLLNLALGNLPFQAPSDVYFGLSLLLLADATRRLGRHSTPKGRLAVGAAFGACVVAAAFTALLFVTQSPAMEDVLQVISALTALAVPLCITYALVKHRLFDAEVKLRFAIKGTTLAAVFLAVFFVVSKVAENYVSDRFGGGNHGVFVGGAVTGLLLFAINPLQKVADRLARRAVPGTGAAHGTHEERLQIYREQLEIAWADGRLTPKERLLFARLQERLGIPADEAGRLETDVLATLVQPRRRRGSAA